MRVIALLIAIFALAGRAAAETPECRAIENLSERLACYDKLSPPIKHSQASTSLNPSTSRPLNYSDSISAEDIRIKEKLNNICRGC
jgi:hypothetical protein